MTILQHLRMLIGKTIVVAGGNMAPRQKTGKSFWK
jgi:hypothetical protein